MTNSQITYDEFLEGVINTFSAALKKDPQNPPRVGQTFFNELVIARPKLAEVLRASEYDPFYRKELKTSMLEYVLENWDTH